MAFKSENFCPHAASRGSGGYFSYVDGVDTLSTIKGANYFSTRPNAGTRDRDLDSDWRLVGAFIEQQRAKVYNADGSVDAARTRQQPVMGLIVCRPGTATDGGAEWVPFVLDETNGNVTVLAGSGAANYLIT